MKKNIGFTLIELMIAIAIIGILASVGYPAYTSAVKKGNRADAIDAMLKLSGLMEEYFMNKNTYDSADINTLVGTDQSADGLYTMSFDADPTDFYYKLVATANGSDPECETLTLDSLGAKGSTGTDPNCW